MKTVFTSPSIIEAYKAKSLLDDAGIESVIGNENVSFLAGEVPYAATWPQVDIINEVDFDKAKNVLVEMKPEKVTGEPWVCSKCKETHEPQFEICWNCGSAKVD